MSGRRIAIAANGPSATAGPAPWVRRCWCITRSCWSGPGRITSTNSPPMVAWAWIPITVFAAFAQTVRNAAQRHLTAELGTLGATLVRFLYGLPFALLWLALVAELGGFALPPLNLATVLWCAL